MSTHWEEIHCLQHYNASFVMDFIWTPKIAAQRLMADLNEMFVRLGVSCLQDWKWGDTYSHPVAGVIGQNWHQMIVILSSSQSSWSINGAARLKAASSQWREKVFNCGRRKRTDVLRGKLCLTRRSWLTNLTSDWVDKDRGDTGPSKMNPNFKAMHVVMNQSSLWYSGPWCYRWRWE